MNQVTSSIVAIFAGLTGLAILAVLVSKNSNTSGVIRATFGGYAQAIGAAVSPVTVGSGMAGSHFQLGGTGVAGGSGSGLY